jgi:hypothetical protein
MITDRRHIDPGGARLEEIPRTNSVHGDLSRSDSAVFGLCAALRRRSCRLN